MNKVKIKLLSANNAWRGKRIKTEDYKVFEKELFFTLPKCVIPDGEIELYIKAGLSSRSADIDNIAKQTIDVMQKKYNFDDKQIYKLVLEKEIVKKGEEYLMFEFGEYALYGRSKCCDAIMQQTGQCMACGADGS